MSHKSFFLFSSSFFQESRYIMLLWWHQPDYSQRLLFSRYINLCKIESWGIKHSKECLALDASDSDKEAHILRAAAEDLEWLYVQMLSNWKGHVVSIPYGKVLATGECLSCKSNCFKSAQYLGNLGDSQKACTLCAGQFSSWVGEASAEAHRPISHIWLGEENGFWNEHLLFC